jgi:hypothetical protein
MEEFGEIMSQGARVDLEDAISDIKSGQKRAADILLERPFFHHMYGRTLKEAEDVLQRKKHRYLAEMPKCQWFYGTTGAGKSHHLYEEILMEKDFYNHRKDNGWWDGYSGEPVIAMNEFRGDVPLGELLSICDKWPHTLPRRGREPVQCHATEVYITSACPPWEIYTNLAESDKLDQLYRRFQIFKMEQTPLGRLMTQVTPPSHAIATPVEDPGFVPP